MSRVEDAVQRLYDRADLRDELTDDEAETLLKWAEGELARFNASSPDDTAFAAKVDTLVKLISQINGYAGRQGQLSAQGADQAPGAIATLAAALGSRANADQVAAAATGTPMSTISALTRLISNTASAAAPPSTHASTSGDHAQ